MLFLLVPLAVHSPPLFHPCAGHLHPYPSCLLTLNPYLHAGHLHPYPSAVTNFKTKDFGTGHAEPRVLDLMTTRHPDVEAKDLLMPNKYRWGGRGAEMH